MLTIQDRYRIKHLLKNKNNSPFVGMVRIYKDGILNTDQTKDGWLYNMTIGMGREFANQAIFKSYNASSSLGNISTYHVNAFSVGSNGSSIDSSDNITLLGPQVCDVESSRPIALNTSCYKNRNGVVDVVKMIPIELITHEWSDDIEFSDCSQTYLTITKCECIIEVGEPSELSTGDVVKIDEALLYATSPTISHTTDATTAKVVPFAHICFAPKFVEKESLFKIEWFIIF